MNSSNSSGWSVNVAKGVALGRVGYGVAMAVAPRGGLRLFGVVDVPGPLVFLTRLFGIRDAVLGAGAAVALYREDSSAQGWVAAGAAADSCDLIAALAFADDLGDAAPLAASIAGVAGAAGWASLPGVTRTTKRV